MQIAKTRLIPLSICIVMFLLVCACSSETGEQGRSKEKTKGNRQEHTRKKVLYVNSYDLITPYFKNTAIPFVFSGVNWDASDYGLPCSNVTGMIEVFPVQEMNNGTGKR